MIGLPDPLAFSMRALEALGGVVEPHDTRCVALLPPSLARDLSVAEEAVISAFGEGAVVSCGIGSPLLDALVERGRSATPVAAVRLAGKAPSEAALRSLASAFVIRNGVSAVGSVATAETWYARCAIAWRIEADERHEGLVFDVVHPQDGGRPGDGGLGARCVPVGDDVEPTAAPTLDAGTSAAWIGRAARLAVAGAANPVLALAARRQERDHQRIASYYAALIAESRAPRRKVDRAAIDAKVGHLVAERDKRIADLAHRYGARISVRLAGLLWVRVATGVVTLSARRRKGQRDIVLRLPAGTRAFDRVPCDGCAGWLDRPALCDDRLHLLCEGCVPDATGRPECPACRRGSAA